MWSLLIEFLDEGVEAFLLLEQIRLGRTSRFLLERAVHSLVRAVLLGLAGLDAFVLDAELQPFDRELSEPGQAARRKRRSVVAADDARHAVLAEEPLEDGPDRTALRALERFAAQHISAAEIRRRQRIAELTVAESKLPFEVGGPDVIGLLRLRQPRRHRRRVSTRSTRPCDQTRAPHPRLHGEARRRRHAWVCDFQSPFDLPRPPRRVRAPRRQNQHNAL